MISGSNIGIYGGTFNSTSIINKTNRTSRGMDILLQWVATGALHNSDELYDAPKCHPHTRVAVLEDIMKWVGESESAWDDFMLWLFGPAGAGKSAIAKRIAEIAEERGLLIADFFFSRTSSTRDTKDRLIATLAYQLAVSIPSTRSYIEDAIERDPVIFNKTVRTQIDTLLIKPFQSLSSTHIAPSQKLIIIDGLDECKDSQAQVAILNAISSSFTKHNLPIKFLVVSRPETDLVTSFNRNEPLKFIHRRLALDDTYRPDDDIRLFFSDKFQHIKLTHPLRSAIPISWPSRELLDMLVRKSSGQFIYASTVVKFVESRRHRPTARLNIILGISPPGTLNPFAELDALYNHLLSDVDDIEITLRVLGLYVVIPDIAYIFPNIVQKPPELFLSLEPGDIQLALINLTSILTYDESSGTVNVLHASLVDFLLDSRRSTIFHIDKASTCTDMVRRILQYVKAPDGIQAGDFELFYEVINLSPWIIKGQLQSDILNFDLDAFINASIKSLYNESHLPITVPIFETFQIWKQLLTDAGLEGRDETEALDRLNKFFGLHLQIYQSDRRLQILLALAVTDVIIYVHQDVPSCRCLDILLEMDNHNLHLVDQRALDLRHGYTISEPRLLDMIALHLDGDQYASAALHCMRFLSSLPKYSERNQYPKAGPTSAEWKATCNIALEMLCKLLRQANASLELVQFIGDHDIHPAVQKHLPGDRVWEVDVHILAFLGRESMCPNWRIVSGIQRSRIIPQQQSANYVKVDEDGRELAWRKCLDPRCSIIPQRINSDAIPLENMM